MLNPVEFNPSTGLLQLDFKANPTDFTPYQEKPVLVNVQAGTCVSIVGPNAIPITSRYNNDLANKPTPFVDGVVLFDTVAGQIAQIATTNGYLYNTTDDLGEIGTLLYLGLNGKLTTVAPNYNNGDRWCVIVGKRTDNSNFIFQSSNPIKLTSQIPTYTIPTEIESVADNIIINTDMAQFTCFQIGIDGNANTITANNAIIPFVDGVTLESGSAGSQILVAKTKGKVYLTPVHFDASEIYWLSSTGIMVNEKPKDTNFQVIVGRTIPGSNQFVFDPQVLLGSNGSGNVDFLTGTSVLTNLFNSVVINSDNDCTIFLPLGENNQKYTLKNAGIGKVTISPFSGDKVENNDSYVLLQNNSIDLIYCNTIWYIN